MCDVDDDDDRSVNDNDSGAKYQYSYCISYTQDQVVLDRQSLPVWMKNPSWGDKSKNCRMSNIVSFNILYFWLLEIWPPTLPFCETFPTVDLIIWLIAYRQHIIFCHKLGVGILSRW